VDNSRWFAKHPDRRFRVRPASPAEARDGRGRIRVPFGYAVFVAVERVTDIVLSRVVFSAAPHIELDVGDEELGIFMGNYFHDHPEARELGAVLDEIRNAGATQRCAGMRRVGGFALLSARSAALFDRETMT